MMWANVIRVTEVAGFVGLALFLPASIRAHARPGRQTDSWILSAAVWCVLAAAVAAILDRWGGDLDLVLTFLRLAAIGLGLAYIARNVGGFKGGDRPGGGEPVDHQDGEPQPQPQRAKLHGRFPA